MANKPIHICDDWISSELPDLETIHSACRYLRSSGSWTEVVGGLKSIAVQFDPAFLTPTEALTLFNRQMDKDFSVISPATSEIELPVCYDPEYGPDQSWIADRLGINADSLADWHSAQQFTVTMVGFMPGFGYLQSSDTIAEIGRLPRPRQRIPAGSIGIIGDQSCIYSFDSPGGWPIIGRTSTNMFSVERQPPSLLVAGQTVRFVAVSKSQFERTP